jgi:hypothetical protein
VVVPWAVRVAAMGTATRVAVEHWVVLEVGMAVVVTSPPVVPAAVGGAMQVAEMDTVMEEE